ncbi:restriction endonuclease type II-like protein [Lactifluus volemus]|nr:restriction endonuclease type II-like protein [Lactifluus volemus]
MDSSSSKGKERQPPVVQPGSANSIIINPCQRLNPIVECIRNVPKVFGDILPDYQVGRTTGVLFSVFLFLRVLPSLRYHRLHPEYIHQRIERLGQSYNLRILLLMCDISEHQEPIRELTRVCLINNITVIVVWSPDEAGQYLTAYKQCEHRPPTLIRERVDKTPSALLRASLTSIPRVNKTDVETLRTSFGSFAKIAQADATQIARLPGFGPKKVARIKDAFERPFRTGTTTPNRVWDIELDLNPPSPEGELAQEPGSSTIEVGAAGGRGESSKRVREESPPWDIEDGAALRDEDSRSDSDDDDDDDMDIAPALRAKRRRA